MQRKTTSSQHPSMQFDPPHLPTGGKALLHLLHVLQNMQHFMQATGLLCLRDFKEVHKLCMGGLQNSCCCSRRHPIWHLTGTADFVQSDHTVSGWMNLECLLSTALVASLHRGDGRWHGMACKGA